jgi:hypothetical protein
MAGFPDPYLYVPARQRTWMMTKKEHTMKLVDEKSGLLECLVCGAKHTASMKPGPDGKFLPENWECVNKCRLIHDDKKPAQKK